MLHTAVNEGDEGHLVALSALGCQHNSRPTGNTDTVTRSLLTFAGHAGWAKPDHRPAVVPRTTSRGAMTAETGDVRPLSNRSTTAWTARVACSAGS